MNRTTHFLLPLVAALAWSLGAARAEAAKVVIVRPAAASPELNETVSRLQGELLSLGLELAIRRTAGDAPRDRTPSHAPGWNEWPPNATPTRSSMSSGELPPATDRHLGPRPAANADPRVSRVALEPTPKTARSGWRSAPSRCCERAWPRSISAAKRAAHGEAARGIRPRPSRRVRRRHPPLRSGTSTCRPAPRMLTQRRRRRARAPAHRAGRLERSPVARAAGGGGGIREPPHPRLGGRQRARRPAIRPWSALAHLRARSVRTLAALRRARGRRAANRDRRRGGRARRGALRRALVLPARRRAWARGSDSAGPDHLTLAAHVQVAEPYVAIHIVDTLVATSGRPEFAPERSPSAPGCDVDAAPRASAAALIGLVAAAVAAAARAPTSTPSRARTTPGRRRRRRRRRP